MLLLVIAAVAVARAVSPNMGYHGMLFALAFAIELVRLLVIRADLRFRRMAAIASAPVGVAVVEVADTRPFRVVGVVVFPALAPARIAVVLVMVADLRLARRVILLFSACPKVRPAERGTV